MDFAEPSREPHEREHFRATPEPGEEPTLRYLSDAPAITAADDVTEFIRPVPAAPPVEPTVVFTRQGPAEPTPHAEHAAEFTRPVPAEPAPVVDPAAGFPRPLPARYWRSVTPNISPRPADAIEPTSSQSHTSPPPEAPLARAEAYELDERGPSNEPIGHPGKADDDAQAEAKTEMDHDSYRDAGDSPRPDRLNHAVDDIDQYAERDGVLSDTDDDDFLSDDLEESPHTEAAPGNGGDEITRIIVAELIPTFGTANENGQTAIRRAEPEPQASPGENATATVTSSSRGWRDPAGPPPQPEPVNSVNSVDGTAEPQRESLNATDGDHREAPDGQPEAGTGYPPVNGVNLQDIHEPSDSHGPPAADRPIRPVRDPAETPSLFEAARNHMSAGDRDFIEKQIGRFVTSTSEGARQDAYEKIQMRAATVVATAIVREVTDRNLRQAYRDGLYEWLGDSFTNQRPTSAAEKDRRELADRFLKAMRKLVRDLAGDVVRELAKELLIEMLFPGAHLLIPPTGLVDAIFAACTLLKIADETH